MICLFVVIAVFNIDYALTSTYCSEIRIGQLSDFTFQGFAVVYNCNSGRHHQWWIELKQKAGQWLKNDESAFCFFLFWRWSTANSQLRNRLIGSVKWCNRVFPMLLLNNHQQCWSFKWAIHHLDQVIQAKLTELAN